jgi:Protein of unknown function (DUF1153)
MLRLVVSDTRPVSDLAADPDAPPSPDTRRWTPRLKAAVVRAVRAGRLTPLEARHDYALTEEELAAWGRALDRPGPAGLRVTRLKQFR